MKTIAILFVGAFLTCLIACDRPECENTNAIFDTHWVESSVYKQELVREIDRVGKENITYWFSEYSKMDDEEFIIVNIQGGDLCAKGLLEVKDWNKIEGIRKSEGVSYRGAQLAGLTFDIVTSGENVDLVYKDLNRIID